MSPTPNPPLAEPAVNIPDVVAEVTVAFLRYEEALNANDVAVLNELFRAAPLADRRRACKLLGGG